MGEGGKLSMIVFSQCRKDVMEGEGRGSQLRRSPNLHPNLAERFVDLDGFW